MVAIGVGGAAAGAGLAGFPFNIGWGPLLGGDLTGARPGGRRPSQLPTTLPYFASTVPHAEFAPTTQPLAVYEELNEEISTLRLKLDEVVSTNLAAFNQKLGEQNIGNIIARVRSPRIP